MVPASVPVRRRRPARSSAVLAREQEEEASLGCTGCIVAGAFQGVQDPAVSLGGAPTSLRVHEDLEDISLTFGSVEAGSPGAAAPPGSTRKLWDIFWVRLGLGETL